MSPKDADAILEIPFQDACWDILHTHAGVDPSFPTRPRCLVLGKAKPSLAIEHRGASGFGHECESHGTNYASGRQRVQDAYGFCLSGGSHHRQQTVNPTARRLSGLVAPPFSGPASFMPLSQGMDLTLNGNAWAFVDPSRTARQPAAPALVESTTGGAATVCTCVEQGDGADYTVEAVMQKWHPMRNPFSAHALDRDIQVGISTAPLPSLHHTTHCQACVAEAKGRGLGFLCCRRNDFLIASPKLETVHENKESKLSNPKRAEPWDELEGWKANALNYKQPRLPDPMEARRQRCWGTSQGGQPLPACKKTGRAADKFPVDARGSVELARLAVIAISPTGSPPPHVLTPTTPRSTPPASPALSGNVTRWPAPTCKNRTCHRRRRCQRVPRGRKRVCRPSAPCRRGLAPLPRWADDALVNLPAFLGPSQPVTAAAAAMLAGMKHDGRRWLAGKASAWQPSRWTKRTTSWNF
ncbi:hypothetical protein DFJ73DRAFT_909459 [Zopfochytrium polystomum]|nr:hypothetical protein DFJ73DRAFT_909459 [Zopfochytrium polystomum]